MCIQGANKRLLQRNKSGYRGVYWDKENNKWAAAVTVHGKTNKVGRFEKLEEAVIARNKFIEINGLDYPTQEYIGVKNEPNKFV